MLSIKPGTMNSHLILLGVGSCHISHYSKDIGGGRKPPKKPFKCTPERPKPSVRTMQVYA